MKTILPVLALAVSLHVNALGIPQTFNQGGTFQLKIGMAFEEFAADPANFAKGAELKGNWERRGESTLVLTDSASVFGVSADEITAQRSGDRVQSIRVVFREKAGADHGKSDLLARVTANVRAFSGDETASTKAGEGIFKSKGITIAVRRGKAREVIVEFTSAA